MTFRHPGASSGAPGPGPPGWAAPRPALDPGRGRRLLSHRHVHTGPGPRPAATVLLVNHLFESSTCFPNLCLENSYFRIFRIYVLTGPGTGSRAPGSTPPSPACWGRWPCGRPCGSSRCPVCLPPLHRHSCKGFHTDGLIKIKCSQTLVYKLLLSPFIQHWSLIVLIFVFNN